MYFSPNDVCIDFREKEKERERNTLLGERNVDRFLPIPAPTRDQGHNLGMCSYWELHLQPFLVYGTTL